MNQKAIGLFATSKLPDTLCAQLETFMKYDNASLSWSGEMAGRLVLVSCASHLIDEGTNLANNDADARGHLFKRKIPIEFLHSERRSCTFQLIDERNTNY